MCIKIVVFIYILVISAADCNVHIKQHHRDHSWDYNDQTKWCNLNKSHCCGLNQSPIDLKSRRIKPTKLKQFNFNDYGLISGSVLIGNNGHTIAVIFDHIRPILKGGGLNNSYKLHSLHFHWGSQDSYGSEHTIDGKPAALELHLVHFNSKLKHMKAVHKSNEPDALAVIGVLYDVDDSRANRELNTITSKLKSIQYNQERAQVAPFDVRKLLPVNTHRFFRYSGSLTTPDCSEIVKWTVFKDRNYLSRKDMALFRELHQNDKRSGYIDLLVNNFRQIQKLNGRKVIYGEETIESLST